MKRVRWALTAMLISVVGGLALGHTTDEQPAGAVVKVLSAVDLAETVDGKPTRATTLEVTFGPGVASAPHRHPGPVFGYVLEGELEFQAGEGPVRRLGPGDSFYEPAMVLHAVAWNPSDEVTTRVLAIMLHPRDVEQLVIGEPATGGE